MHTHGGPHQVVPVMNATALARRSVQSHSIRVRMPIASRFAKATRRSRDRCRRCATPPTIGSGAVSSWITASSSVWKFGHAERRCERRRVDRRDRAIGGEIGRGDRWRPHIRRERRDMAAACVAFMISTGRIAGEIAASKLLHVAEHRAERRRRGRRERRTPLSKPAGAPSSRRRCRARRRRSSSRDLQRATREGLVSTLIGEPCASSLVKVVIAAAFFGFNVTDERISAATGIARLSPMNAPLGVGCMHRHASDAAVERTRRTGRARAIARARLWATGCRRCRRRWSTSIRPPMR